MVSLAVGVLAGVALVAVADVEGAGFEPVLRGVPCSSGRTSWRPGAGPGNRSKRASSPVGVAAAEPEVEQPGRGTAGGCRAWSAASGPGPRRRRPPAAPRQSSDVSVAHRMPPNHRKRNLPFGWFDPCTCWWQFAQDLPYILLAFCEVIQRRIPRRRWADAARSRGSAGRGTAASPRACGRCCCRASRGRWCSCRPPARAPTGRARAFRCGSWCSSGPPWCPSRSSFTFTEPCTLWHDEQVILPSRTGMWLKRCCLLVTVWWHLAQVSCWVFARISVGPSARVHAVAVDALDVAVLVLAAVPQRVLAAVVAGLALARWPALADDLGELDGLDLLGVAGVRLARAVARLAALLGHRRARVGREAMLGGIDGGVVAGVAAGAGLRADIARCRSLRLAARLGLNAGRLRGGGRVGRRDVIDGGGRLQRDRRHQRE